MAIPTVSVSVSLKKPTGPVVNASVSAKATGPLVYDSVVVPDVINAVTGADGSCVLNLCPTAGTDVTYTVEVRLPGATRATYFYDVVVPNVSAITLEELLGYKPTNALSDWLDSAMWDDALTWSES